METDIYGQQIFDEKELCDLYMQDPGRTIKLVLVKKPINFILDIDHPMIKEYKSPKLTVEEFDLSNQANWYIPDEYADMNIAQWVLDQCKTDEELQRVGDELIKYLERDMFPMLRYLKYLVDTMKKHKVIYGVGRGSSVASYVLYLIGVHRINSLEYQLPIEEFLK
jgi:DNA polymerase III alpha subunit